MRIISTIVLFLLIPISVFSAPSISSVTGSDTLTITGADFSAKATPTPIKWMDCEGLTASDQSLTVVDPFWEDRGTANNYARINTLQQRYSGSTKNIEAYMKDEAHPTGARGANFWKNSIGFSATGKGLVSFWVRLDEAVNNSDDSYQFKGIRTPANVGEDGSPTYPDLALFNWDSTSILFYFQNHGGASTGYFPSNHVTYPGWYHVTLQFEMGTAGNADGRWIGWSSHNGFTGTYVVQDDYWPAASYQLINADLDDMNAVSFHNYLGNTESDPERDVELTIYYDDIYIDNVWNRVEIGDNSVFANCTHREIQIPTAWSDTEISFTLNTGSLASGTYYVFVVDSDGTASSGSQITIGTSKTIGPGTTTTFKAGTTATLN